MDQSDNFTIIQFTILIIAIIIGLYTVLKNPNKKKRK